METRRSLEQLLTSKTASLPAIEYSRPVALYGAGRLGKMALSLLAHTPVRVACLIDRNAETLAAQFKLPVYTPEEAAKKLAHDTPVFDCIFKDQMHLARTVLTPLGFNTIHTINDLFSNLPDLHYTNGWQSGPLSDEDKQGISTVYTALADEASRVAYFDNLSWRIAREPHTPERLPLIAEEEKYFNALTHCEWLHNTRFIDAGSFDLYFARQALDPACNPFMPAIVEAYEPEPQQFLHCKKIAATLPTALQQKLRVYDVALSEKTENQLMLCGNDLASRLVGKKVDGRQVISRRTATLDDIATEGKPIKYLKLHVEGEELSCLKGGTRLLAKYRPLINVNCTHNRDALWRIAHFIMQHTPKYRYYFRSYANYGEGLTFYAVPHD